MTRRNKFRLGFAAACGCCAAALSWLMWGETSPLNAYFMDHAASDLWRVPNLIPYIASLFVAGNPHRSSPAVFFLFVFAQWFLIGLALSILISKFARKKT